MRRLGVLVVSGMLVGAVVATSGPHRSATVVARLPQSAALAASTGTSWTVYHGNPIGSGVDSSGLTFASPPAFAWASPHLAGQVYGEPLASGGRVFVATEDDWVYALDAATGGIVWQKNVGSPVPSGSLPCGNITPNVGITGTPVIDESRGEIFVVADETNGTSISHHLVGLAVGTGNVVLDQVVDPAGSIPSTQLQRTGLNLSNGNVVFGLGGNEGDCGQYNGWVVAVPEGGGNQAHFEVDTGNREGAIWMGGAAPEVDASGNVWVAAGNGSVTSNSTCPGLSGYDDSDSVLELSPTMGLLQFFAPSNWCNQNLGDQDLGSAAPALLSDGRVLQVGKSHTGYLLNQGALGGIGGQIATAAVCSGGSSAGGDAVSGTDVFIPCGGGLQEVHTTTSGASLAWTAHDSSGRSIAGGSPIIAAGKVWSIGGSTLYEIDPTTGLEVSSVSLGSEANHFPTPSVGDGLLLAPSTDQVYAFSASSIVPRAGVAFQANTGSLWTWNGAQGTSGYGASANLGMSPGSSPDITSLGNGQSAAAFDANTGSLWTWIGAPGTTGYGAPAKLGIAPGTSPSVTSLGNGQVAVAFNANTGSLWTWIGAPGTTGYGAPAALGVAPGTSPSVTSLGNGQVAVAFKANTGSLWTWIGAPGTTGYGAPAALGMAANSSPSITALGNGQTGVAFDANTGSLWTWVGAPGTTGYGAPAALGMAANTGPAIA